MHEFDDHLVGANALLGQAIPIDVHHQRAGAGHAKVKDEPARFAEFAGIQSQGDSGTAHEQHEAIVRAFRDPLMQGFRNKLKLGVPQIGSKLIEDQGHGRIADKERQRHPNDGPSGPDGQATAGLGEEFHEGEDNGNRAKRARRVFSTQVCCRLSAAARSPARLGTLMVSGKPLPATEESSASDRRKWPP